ITGAEALWAQVTGFALAYAFSILGAIVLIIVGYMVAGLLERWTRAGLARFPAFDQTLRVFLSKIVRYAVLVLVGVTVLAQFGVQTASLIAALGAAGLAIGLALQGTLQNIAAGIMLLVLKPFRVGEYIDTGDINGIVQDIGLFATELKTYDGLYRLAPNSLLWNVPVTNYSRLTTRMHDFKVGIAYEDDIDKAISIMLDIVRQDDRVLDTPEPSAFVMELGDSSVVLAMRYWANSSVWWMTTRDITKAVKN